MPECPTRILELVERFKLNQDHYKSTGYNEEQLRHEFLNPMFEVLGWDMTNSQGKSDAYKEVLYEEAIKAGAPDFTFRIGSERKFFLEAKAPSVNLAVEWEPAVQIRSYARSAGLSLSILTNFAQFAVYDGRIPISSKIPKPTEGLAFPIISYLDFPDRWKEIESIFSNKAVWSGLFDRFADSKVDRRRTFPIGEEFLSQISSWRKELAWTIRRDNSDVDSMDLNFAVQMTIDRIVFLRICEDRGIEPFGQLQRLLSVRNIYGELKHFFTDADAKYNSGLFHFRKEAGRDAEPDRTTLDLEIKDEVLKSIIRDLYESHYKFDVIPTEILGQVYEQFLGKTIVLTEKTARVEDKPEVSKIKRKSGGVYYTPSYIVKYIVDHTLGKLLENKAPDDVEKLTILDPACGSGSFLIGAYQKLLDWHLDYYHHHDPEKLARQKNPPIRQIANPDTGGLFQAKPSYRLTISERKRILINNVYGVDLDRQAVEVTKLSLLLKCLEGETSESVQTLLKFMRQRALPDLDGNIKWGNSLIGHDFHDPRKFPDNQDLSSIERARVNSFDWEVEFKEVSRSGGFGVIIGNPPYILLQDEFRDDRQLHYFRERYEVASFKLDTYHLFMEQAISLLKKGGRFGFITPANYLTNNHLDVLRRYILEHATVDHINVIEGGVFGGVSVDTAISIFVRGEDKQREFKIIRSSTDGSSLTEVSRNSVDPALVRQNKHLLFTGTSDSSLRAVWNRVESASATLGSFSFVNFGKQLRDRTKFPRDVISVPGEDVPRGYRRCLTGKDVSRYQLSWGHLACIQDRAAQSGGCWDDSVHQSKGKLLTRQIGKVPAFVIDREGYDCLNTMFMVKLREPIYAAEYVLGILNSRLMQAYWLDKFYDQRKTFPKIKGTYLKLLPVRVLDLSVEQEKLKHDQIVICVRRILELRGQLEKVKSGREQIQRQIDAMDKNIDAFVYDLYGLGAEEVALVEASMPRGREESTALSMDP